MALTGAVISVALALGGCAPPTGGEVQGDEGMARGIENRAWVEGGDGGGLPGTIMTFSSGGELLIASCWAVPRVASWRWTGPAMIEWIDETVRIRAEIGLVGPDVLVLLIDTDGDGTGQARRYQRVGFGSPCAAAAPA